MYPVLNVWPSIFFSMFAAVGGEDLPQRPSDPGWKKPRPETSLHQKLAQYLQTNILDFDVTWHPKPLNATSVIFQRFYASSSRVTYTWHQGGKRYQGYARIYTKSSRLNSRHSKVGRQHTLPYIVERQHTLTVLYQSSDLSLKLQGLKALKPGKKGEKIPVLNPKTQKKIWVTVVAPGLGYVKEEGGL